MIAKRRKVKRYREARTFMCGSISLPYHHTTGNETLVDYCVEPPREVLETAFENYHVTCYNGYELFSCEDFESTTPMLGLGIAPIEPPKVYGIEYNRRLENLLQLEELLKAKRDKPIEEFILRLMNPENNQIKHDKQEIIDIVKRFR